MITQINDVFCYFRSLDSFVKCDLLYRYCNSLYGSVLWSLQDNEINRICSAWRTAIKRAWNLPRNTHCNIVTKLSGRLAIFDELCKRVVKFHYECLNSPNKLVNTLCKYTVSDGTPLSPHGRNLLFICNHYNIVDNLGLLVQSLNEFFLLHPEKIVTCIFIQFYDRYYDGNCLLPSRYFFSMKVFFYW